MDTTSHIIIGLGLGDLAQVDPVVSNSSLSYAVVLGTVSGSNAPDADCIFKMKEEAAIFVIIEDGLILCQANLSYSLTSDKQINGQDRHHKRFCPF